METDRKKARHENSTKFIPQEITDEILLRLPFKSLFRFSSVSKSWNSSILSNAWLADKYRARKALVFEGSAGKNLSFLALSNDRNQTGDDVTTTALVCPLSKNPYLVVSCDTLLCAWIGTGSLCLWNPWTTTYRQIRGPSYEGWGSILGLGYDAVGDDYKMLSANYQKTELQLYSLRSDSWRKIQHSHSLDFMFLKSVFVSRTFHWIHRRSITSFDLSTEKFGEVTGPKYAPLRRTSQLAACNGKLCVCFQYRRSNLISFVMWTMEDYGITESWTKTFEISFDVSPIRAVMKRPTVMKRPIRAVMKRRYLLTYLHSYDDGRILIEVSNTPNGIFILLYEDNKVVPLINVSHKILDCFLLVESFVRPN